MEIIALCISYCSLRLKSCHWKWKRAAKDAISCAVIFVLVITLISQIFDPTKSTQISNALEINTKIKK
jgi:hypothetical protein